MSQQDPPPDPFASFESARPLIKPSAGRGARTGGAAPAATAPALPPDEPPVFLVRLNGFFDGPNM